MKFGKKLKIVSKNFDSEPVYNEKHLKTKIKSYNGKINTNFHNSKIPKERRFTISFLTVLLIDSGKNYYPHVF